MKWRVERRYLLVGFKKIIINYYFKSLYSLFVGIIRTTWVKWRVERRYLLVGFKKIIINYYFKSLYSLS